VYLKLKKQEKKAENYTTMLKRYYSKNTKLGRIQTHTWQNRRLSKIMQMGLNMKKYTPKSAKKLPY